MLIYLMRHVLRCLHTQPIEHYIAQVHFFFKLLGHDDFSDQAKFTMCLDHTYAETMCLDQVVSSKNFIFLYHQVKFPNQLLPYPKLLLYETMAATNSCLKWNTRQK
jgi:hypothetical protein